MDVFFLGGNMIKEFEKFVKQYDMNNDDIIAKYKHSIRVSKICEVLAKLLNFSEEDTYVLKLIGLLHDIGKFEQIKLKDNYNDTEFDHALYGVMLLFKEGLIENYDVDPKYYDLIEFSILNHNRYKIEDTSDAKKILFAKLIRDAEKIDIFEMYTYLKSHNLKVIDDNVTNEVTIQFRKHELINRKIRKTKADLLISIVAFVFDINFNESLKIIYEQNYLGELYKEVSNNENLKEYFENAKDYIKERID